MENILPGALPDILTSIYNHLTPESKKNFILTNKTIHKLFKQYYHTEFVDIKHVQHSMNSHITYVF